MGEADNVRAVERLVEGLNAKDVEVMNEVFVDDSVLSWPQSGEIIRGHENRQGLYRAFPSLPTITPYRTVASGDLVTCEAELDYGTETYQVVFIFECRDGLIHRETAYWAKPFPAPDWRAGWVERAWCGAAGPARWSPRSGLRGRNADIGTSQSLDRVETWQTNGRPARRRELPPA